jgi:hypothetical protein
MYEGRMRWMVTVVALLSSACLRQEDSPERVDAGVVGLPEDAGAPFDPCAWNGRSGYCYAEAGFVFSDGRCHSVCGSYGQTNGTVFETSAECHRTCSCRPEKFSGVAERYEVGGNCGQAWAIVEAIPFDWAGCRRGSLLTGPEYFECPIEVVGTVDLDERATLCAASAIAREVVCVENAAQ